MPRHKVIEKLNRLLAEEHAEALIERILDTLEMELDQIKQMGIQNYLIEQI